MKRTLGIAWFIVGALVARAAEENFSRAVRPEDFSAAGLAKLSPEELARLDTLVRDYKSGALAAAKREAEAAAKARADAETRAAQAEARAEAAAKAEASAKAAAVAKENEKPKAEGPSLLSRAKVLLTPGTKIEYETVESRIVGNFTGWNSGTVFTLENGQRWKLQNPDSYYTPAIANPKVTITPAQFGGFWMKVDGVSSRVRVMPLGGN